MLGRAGRRLGRWRPSEDATGTRGRRLRNMLEELGPTFVKFGQLLSTRPDLVPADIVEELRALQDHVRPVEVGEIHAAIEREFGHPALEVFAALDEEPLASASIGQVHRATLHDGREVVVKVQRPGAEETLNADVALMYQIARIMRERVKRVGFIDVVGIVDEFARTARNELDYRIEGRNTEVVRRHFEGDPTVRVPSVVWEHTTARILTMEALPGTVLAHLDLAAMSDEERRRLAHRISETWMKMVFDHGFFQADPHPANILVSSPDELGLVDFGMVGQLMPSDRRAAVGLFVDVIEQNADRLPRRLRELGVRYPRELEPEFREEIAAIVARYHGARMSEIDARNLLREIFQTIQRLGITLPSRWVLLDKTIATLAGVGLEISPDFNVFETARPYARRLIAQRLRPGELGSRLRSGGERYVSALLDAPAQVSGLLTDMRDGEIRLTVDRAGAKEAADRQEATGNRIALAVAGLGVLAASTGLAFGAGGPAIAGIAVLAIPGLGLGAVLAAWVVAGVVRSGRW